MNNLKRLFSGSLFFKVSFKRIVIIEKSHIEGLLNIYFLEFIRTVGWELTQHKHCKNTVIVNVCGVWQSCFHSIIEWSTNVDHTSTNVKFIQSYPPRIKRAYGWKLLVSALRTLLGGRKKKPSFEG